MVMCGHVLFVARDHMYGNNFACFMHAKRNIISFAWRIVCDSQGVSKHSEKLILIKYYKVWWFSSQTLHLVRLRSASVWTLWIETFIWTNGIGHLPKRTIPLKKYWMLDCQIKYFNSLATFLQSIVYFCIINARFALFRSGCRSAVGRNG